MISRTARTSRIAISHHDLFDSGPLEQQIATLNLTARTRRSETPIRSGFKLLKIIPATTKKQQIQGPLGSDILGSLDYLPNEVSQYRRKMKKQYQMTLERSRSPTPDASIAITPSLLTHRQRETKRQLSSIYVRSKVKQPRSASRGTMSVLIVDDSRLPAIEPKAEEDFVCSQKMNHSTKNKEKLRRGVLNWILDYKTEEVNKINQNHELIVETLANLGALDRENFFGLLREIKIKYDSSFYDRLFWLFDRDGDGLINQKEMFVMLETLGEINFEEKLKIFFELADYDRKDLLNEEKLVRFFEKNLKRKEEAVKVKLAVKILIEEELNLISKDLITLQDLKRGCDNIHGLKVAIENIVKPLKPRSNPIIKVTALNILAKETLLPNTHLSAEGYSVPYMEKIIKAIEEKQGIAIKSKGDIQNNNGFLKSLKFPAKTQKRSILNV